ncbi:MAG: dipeptide epimerase [Chitinophagaceae bacterium]|nr:MAG: dipeptide epimerase [Chitinophagaceae bacterium]
MLQVRHFAYELEFEYPFTISKGTKTHQPTLIVSLGMGNLTGYGEAPAIHYYNTTIASMTEALEAKKGIIMRHALTDPQRFWHFLEHLLPGQNFLIAALDIAGWDLFAKLRRQPLYRLLGLNRNNIPLTDYTIGIDSPERMVEKLLAHPAPVYKIKMRSTDDLDLLIALRAVTDKPFRIDANEAFTLDETKALLPEWSRLGVTLVEQPLPRQDWEAMKELRTFSAIPLFADESCVSEADVEKCAEGFNGINIKLTKCAGITPALRMVHQARKLGLKVMMGSMNETTIGTAAVAHLMPLLDEVDADGPLLLKEDVASGLLYNNGHIGVSESPGLGTVFFGEKRTK